jgi:hypothetical protein
MSDRGEKAVKDPASSVFELTEEELDRARIAAQFLTALLSRQDMNSWSDKALVDCAFSMADEFRQQTLKRRL